MKDVKVDDNLPTSDNESGKCRRQEDLCAYLAEKVRRYNADILPLYPDIEHGDDNGFELFDEAKSEFLESLWDGIMQHFGDGNISIL